MAPQASLCDNGQIDRTWQKQIDFNFHSYFKVINTITIQTLHWPMNGGGEGGLNMIIRTTLSTPSPAHHSLPYLAKQVIPTIDVHDPILEDTLPLVLDSSHLVNE